jgi:hypothetical protein
MTLIVHINIIKISILLLTYFERQVFLIVISLFLALKKQIQQIIHTNKKKFVFQQALIKKGSKFNIEL